MDWSLYRCGTAGHLTFAPHEPELREHMYAGAGGIDLWRCLRCGTFVSGEPTHSGQAAHAPVVRRGKEIRGEIVLRIFAVERLIRFVAAVALAYLVWKFKNSQLSLQASFSHELPILRTLFRELGININHSRIVGLVNHALRASPRLLLILAIGLIVYAVVELIEGIGLWLAKRWGEYFAAVVTSLGLPYEAFELASKFTWTKLVLTLINLALVLYLVLSRRLFGARGGKEAYEARLRSISVIDEARQAAAIKRAALAEASAAEQPAAGEPVLAEPASAGQPAAGPADRSAAGDAALAEPASAGQPDPGSR